MYNKEFLSAYETVSISSNVTYLSKQDKQEDELFPQRLSSYS